MTSMYARRLYFTLFFIRKIVQYIKNVSTASLHTCTCTLQCTVQSSLRLYTCSVLNLIICFRFYHWCWILFENLFAVIDLTQVKTLYTQHVTSRNISILLKKIYSRGLLLCDRRQTVPSIPCFLVYSRPLQSISFILQVGIGLSLTQVHCSFVSLPTRGKGFFSFLCS